MDFNTKCSQCGCGLNKKKCHLTRYKNFFCNRKCHAEFNRKDHINNGNCDNCKCNIIINNKKRRNSKTGLFFCGNQCKNEYIAKNKRWSVSTDCHRKRRPKIIKAANSSCQNCGYNKNVKMLDIHHNDGNHQNNDWDNLRCVCSWCHQKHHRKVEKLNDLPKLAIEET